MDHFAALVEEFKDLDNFDRYQNILDWANDAEVLPQIKKLPQNLVAGCASNLWVDIDQNIIKSDADAVITKGLASMFCDLFNKFTKQDAKMFDPKLLQSLGFVLSPSRANGMINLIFKLKELKNDIK
jgi:cysteine desulfuration protein SufE